MRPEGARLQRGRFLNPDGSPPGQPLLRVWKMLREGKGTPWPAQVIDPPFPPPPDTVPAGHAAITFLGHASFLIRLADGNTLLTDPIFSERCSPVPFLGPKRVRAPGIALADLPRIDTVLLSHGHYDHLDLPSLRALHAAHRPRIVTGLRQDHFLRGNRVPGAIGLNWWEHTDLPGGHRATYLPAKHFSARGIHDRGRALWGGFALQTADGGRLCFLGDTGWGGHLAQIGAHAGPFGAALIPIGAYEPRWFMKEVHMDPTEAVAALSAIGARTGVAMHHGTFKLTQEAIDAPLEALAVARAAAGVPASRFLTPGCGETVVLDLRP